MQNRNLSDNALISMIAPGLVDAASVDSGWLPVSNAVRTFFIILLGATDITVDAKVEQATNAAGTGTVKDVTGAALTQLTAGNDGKFATIDLESAALDHHNGYNHVRLTLTAGDGTAGANLAAVIIRTCRHMPPTQLDTYLQAIQVAG